MLETTNLDCPDNAASRLSLPIHLTGFSMAPLQRLSTKAAVLSLLLICLTYVVNAMDRSVFPVLLPGAAGVAHEFAFPLATGGLLATLFSLGLGIAGLPGGFLFDRMSRKSVAVLGIVIYSICTVLTCLSVGFYDMAAYRVVSGIGEALQNAAIFSIAGAYFLRNRTLALSVLNVAYGLGSFIGPRWGSALMEQHGSWRTPMVVFGIAGLLGAVLMAVLISRRFSEQVGVVSLRSIAEEAHVPDTLVNRNTVLLSIVSVCVGLATFGFIGLYATYLRNELHFSAAQTASAFSMYGIGALMAIPAGLIADRISQKSVQLFGLVLMAAVGYAMFNLARTPAAQAWLSFGEGMAASGILYVNGYALMQRATRAAKIGRSSGLYVTCFYLAAGGAGWCFGKLTDWLNWGNAAIILISGQLVIAFILMLFVDMKRVSNRPTPETRVALNTDAAI
jgi:MFS family permease